MIGPRAADPHPDEVANAFGKLIRRHRTRIGLTQRELADLSTISERAIRDLEQGRATRPRNDTVRLIADGLRLGPAARTELERAALQGRTGRPLSEEYLACPPGPPTTADPLFGREAQVRALTAELAGGERLVHLVGLGGVGKTRVALEVAARLHSGSGMPVLWSAPRDAVAGHVFDDAAERLAPVVRSCVDALFAPDPAGGNGADALAALVGDRPALLVLDGVDDRPPRSGAVLGLLRRCPRLRLLVTSSAPFGVAQERVVPLEPLAVADPPVPAHGSEDADGEDGWPAERSPATELLLHHIRRVLPGFTPRPGELGTLSRICRLLDGLPAALRAAASWMLIYDVATLHACLADGPESLLGHLAGTEADGALPAALARMPLRLPEPVQELLSALCGQTEGVDRTGPVGHDDRSVHSGRADGFGLADVMALTGAGLSDSGRMVRELLLAGAVRAVPAGGPVRFGVLNLVRASLPYRRPGTARDSDLSCLEEAAALLPGQPPIGVPGRP